MKKIFASFLLFAFLSGCAIPVQTIPLNRHASQDGKEVGQLRFPGFYPTNKFSIDGKEISVSRLTEVKLEEGKHQIQFAQNVTRYRIPTTTAEKVGAVAGNILADVAMFALLGTFTPTTPHIAESHPVISQRIYQIDFDIQPQFLYSLIGTNQNIFINKIPKHINTNTNADIHIQFKNSFDPKYDLCNVLISDERGERTYEKIPPSTLKIGPNNKRVAFLNIAKGNGSLLLPFRYSFVIDGEETEVFEKVINNSPFFSHDGKRVFWGGKTGDGWKATIDGKESTEYEEILTGLNVFSPDSKSYAFFGKRGGRWALNVNGEEGNFFDEINPLSLFFSPDGQRIVFMAKAGKKWGLIENNQKIAEYEQIIWSSISFSQNSERLAFISKKDNDFLVIVDGKEVGEYESILPKIHFSDDGKHYAFAAESSNKWFVVVDGKKEKEYDFIAWDSLKFSPDGKNFAYCAIQSGKWLTVFNGKESAPYDEVFLGTPTFTPDSEGVVVAAKDGNILKITVNNETVFSRSDLTLDVLFDGETYQTFIFDNDTKTITFSFDGKKETVVWVPTKKEEPEIEL